MSLIGQDLGVGPPGVVIYRIMPASLTAALVTVPVVFAPGHREFSVATIENPAECLESHMNQLTGRRLIIVDEGQCAHR